MLDKINTTLSCIDNNLHVLKSWLKQKGRMIKDAPIILKDATIKEGASIKRKITEERPREKTPRIKKKGKIILSDLIMIPSVRKRFNLQYFYLKLFLDRFLNEHQQLALQLDHP